ncbi:probable cation transporter HKT6 isoform X3 [Brachypodium distachyon]|uniref:Uncharacterized protein n=1 Tax=Brachypodium distachyon TaxID=15368 RepID=A0A0Q3LM99_BRADI|nr:probable cation transporter HKT6 isoform X3 [Brachypodium distachyon]KQJ93589.1 hypothetical protein BRADI_3g05570v3 [Brachypodium distachyon]|eukprot:XP_010233891.1 probable cation transporter HKT6 isoform X3 [Brachypodium distachyon]
MKHSRVATKLSSFAKSGQQSMKYSCQFICQTNPLFIQLTYFTLISFAGYEALKVLKSQDKSNTMKDLDLLFTSVSASTVSSMATVEMEDFSSTQLWILAILMLIGSEILAGNTLFAPCLRYMVWTFKKITGKEECHFILQHPKAIGCRHLMSTRKCVYLVVTVVSFIILQTILFCSLEWSSEALQEMSSYEKIVGALFQSTNARHAGESVVDLSSVSSAITVLYTVMMYLPGYTSFLHNYEDPYSKARERDNSRRLLKDWVFSQLSYLAIFLMLICITEREAMTTDPLNFNVFSILFEIVSAYGNVGFSVGYSCKRLLKHDVYCKDASYGFVGKWSDKGKLILIVVMVFGRLKTFNLKGGSAWKLR